MTDVVRMRELAVRVQLASQFEAAVWRYLNDVQIATARHRLVGPWELAESVLEGYTQHLSILVDEAQEIKAALTDGALITRAHGHVQLIIECRAAAQQAFRMAHAEKRERALDATEGEVRS